MTKAQYHIQYPSAGNHWITRTQSDTHLARALHIRHSCYRPWTITGLQRAAYAHLCNATCTNTRYVTNMMITHYCTCSFGHVVIRHPGPHVHDLIVPPQLCSTGPSYTHALPLPLLPAITHVSNSSLWHIPWTIGATTIFKLQWRDIMPASCSCACTYASIAASTWCVRTPLPCPSIFVFHMIVRSSIRRDH